MTPIAHIRERLAAGDTYVGASSTFTDRRVADALADVEHPTGVAAIHAIIAQAAHSRAACWHRHGYRWHVSGNHGARQWLQVGRNCGDRVQARDGIATGSHRQLDGAS